VEACLTTDQELAIKAIKTDPSLAVAFLAMAEAATVQNLGAKTVTVLEKAAAALPTPPRDADNGGALRTVDGHQAVVGRILVKGQQVDKGDLFETLLSEGSLNKTRDEQKTYAAGLGYRMATPDEYLAYVTILLSKEIDGSVNSAETKALQSFRDGYVRNTEGAYTLVGRRVVGHHSDGSGCGHANFAALFVRASAESK
jgi:hypothetical protein